MGEIWEEIKKGLRDLKIKNPKEFGLFALMPAVITFVGILLLTLICSIGSWCSRGMYFIPHMFGVVGIAYYAFKYSEKELTPIHYFRTMLLMIISILFMALVSFLIPTN